MALLLTQPASLEALLLARRYFALGAASLKVLLSTALLLWRRCFWHGATSRSALLH
jgi:hypothetical protein